MKHLNDIVRIKKQAHAGTNNSTTNLKCISEKLKEKVNEVGVSE
jgi:hypothetical protein